VSDWVFFWYQLTRVALDKGQWAVVCVYKFSVHVFNTEKSYQNKNLCWHWPCEIRGQCQIRSVIKHFRCRLCGCHSYYNQSLYSGITTSKILNLLVNKRPHTTILRPFFWDHPGEPVPEENFWTLCCNGRLTEADTATIWLGTTPSGLTTGKQNTALYVVLTTVHVMVGLNVNFKHTQNLQQ